MAHLLLFPFSDFFWKTPIISSLMSSCTNRESFGWFWNTKGFPNHRPYTPERKFSTKGIADSCPLLQSSLWETPIKGLGKKPPTAFSPCPENKITAMKERRNILRLVILKETSQAYINSKFELPVLRQNTRLFHFGII